MLSSFIFQPTIFGDMKMIPLNLENRPIVMDYLRRFPPQVSELTFTNLFVWRKSRPVWFVEQEGSLVFVVEEDATTKGRHIIGPVVGRQLPAEVLHAEIPDLLGFIRIPEETAAALKHEGLRVESDDDNSDYVYRTADLAELKGEKYHKKRNLVKQCLEANKCRYVPITPDLIPDCVGMLDQWCYDRRESLDQKVADEYRAIREMFTSYDKLELIAGAILVNGCLQAYAVGEELSPGMAVCHFEKATPEIQGLSQLLNQWFAGNSLKQFEFVNREQDLGIPGLRQAKQSYYPCRMVRKFKAFFPDSSERTGHKNER